ncbi:MAG TPA: aminotransferase class V-fold PLP-dependent enzyme [Dehalococcoidia bacterium]|nr:aminotransferase class V-fold PLP-dependent enzyme [Dehalococcoidia bacterium]
MSSEESARLYQDLGVRPVINAAGAYTLLGGSMLSARVRSAMEDANRYFVEMAALLQSSGEIIARMLECEAAYITSGAAGALALSAAACMTGSDPAKIEQLPDTTGMKDEILIQRVGRIKYDRCVTIPGAKLVEFGGPEKTSVDDLAEAFTAKTCAVHYLATGTRPGSLPLEDIIRLAHDHGVPVIVDAAGQTYPTDELRRYARMGADLVCYAGKYFDAPHSTGLITGRRELVEAAALNGFVSFETNGLRSIGRPMKIDRQEIVGCVVALREWLSMDHEDRLMKYGERCEAIMRAIAGIPNIEARRLSEVEQPMPVFRDGLRIWFREGAPKTAAQVERELREGTPSIWTRAHDGALNISVAFFEDGEDEVVAQRLRAVLTS